jgi:CRISPR-associated protein Cse2 family
MTMINDVLRSFVADPRNRAILRRANRSTGHHDFAIRCYNYAPLKSEVKPWLIDPLRTIALLLDACPDAHDPGAKPGVFVRQLFCKEYGREFEKVCSRLARSSRQTACRTLERKLYLARKIGATVDIEHLYNDLKYWTTGSRSTAVKWVVAASEVE